MENDFRIGYGYDVHRLVEGRDLTLGGVTIPHKLGLDGHSDADVLLHAISDALLGALALGDIGKHFPDTDEAFKNADSRLLLKKVYGLIKEKGFGLVNIDSVIVAQQPRLAPYIAEIRTNIAEDLAVEPDRVSVKATTSEKLGFEGGEQGISARAAVLITKST
ncbi:MAG TPA: 2-C-methyl-D-erythritol 2,4-cyclodiphosphate synthase [Halalkalibaculum sp.]|nr:2-C-methyl-D-erythritol 2,4-cyclodiphosphate synthase [Halalkalibaculum sp.]